MSEAFVDPCGEAYKRGVDHLENNDSVAAIRELTRAIALDPKYVNAYLARGYAHCETDDPEQALADYTEACRLAPDRAGLAQLRRLVGEAQETL